MICIAKVSQILTQQIVSLFTFHLPCHKLKPNIESKLDALLKQNASQFAKDETSIGKSLLTEMIIGMGTSKPVS